jgi:acetyltransferase-like isoleucine patch superfamily enzyme
MISDHVVIMDSDLHPLSASKRLKDMIAWTHGVPFDVYTGIESRPVFVRDGVWIGANAVVLKGVTVGRGAIVGAGSVVTKDVPEYTVVAGNPARTIRELGAELR